MDFWDSIHPPTFKQRTANPYCITLTRISYPQTAQQTATDRHEESNSQPTRERTVSGSMKDNEGQPSQVPKSSSLHSPPKVHLPFRYSASLSNCYQSRHQKQQTRTWSQVRLSVQLEQLRIRLVFTSNRVPLIYPCFSCPLGVVL